MLFGNGYVKNLLINFNVVLKIYYLQSPGSALHETWAVKIIPSSFPCRASISLFK